MPSVSSLKIFKKRFLDRDFWESLGIFILALSLRLAYFSEMGVARGSDADFYQAAASLLQSANFNFATFIENDIRFFYWIYPTLLAFLGGNETLIVIAQIIFQSFVAILIYRIGSMLFDTKTGLIAGIMYACFWELFQWDMYVLTDSIYVGLLVVLVYSLLLNQRQKTRYTLGAVYLTIFGLILLRPTTFPLLASLYWLFTPRLAKRLRVGLPISLILGLFIWLLSKGAFDPNSSSIARAYVEYFQSLFRDGIIIKDRPLYTLSVAWDQGFTLSNIGNFLNIFIHRLISFWYIWTAEFTWPHILLNIVMLGSVYILGIYGLIKSRQLTRYRSILTFIILTILFYWLFQSLFEIDYDWRYRLPVLPLVILFASFGVKSIINHFLKKKSGINRERLSSRLFFPVWVKKEHQARFKFASRFTKNKIVIDCACGNGEGSLIFAQKAKVVKAFDISSEAITEASEKFGNPKIIYDLADSCHLPLGAKSADTYISLETIEHIKDDRLYLKEARRVLVPGGLFICSTPNRSVTNPGKKLSDKPTNIFHIREYSPKEFKDLLESYFSQVELFGQNPYSHFKSNSLNQLGRIIPGHFSTRLHQIIKLIGSNKKMDDYYRVRKLSSKFQHEYLIAVCHK